MRTADSTLSPASPSTERAEHLPVMREISGHAPSPVELAAAKAQACLLSMQDATGFWRGELQGDSILESEYLLMKFILGQEDDSELPLIANYLRGLQQPDGGWNMYPGGKADISGTVKGYFALKLMGDLPDAPHMVRARKLILAMGGAERCNTFTKFFFACLGQISFDACPSIPPEIVLLPKWFFFNLYNVSAWTRTMILPLGIVTTFRYTRTLRPEQGIRELYIDWEAANRLSAVPPSGIPTSWEQFFLRVDQALKVYEMSPLKPLRAHALEKAEKWLLEHLDGSEGLGAIFPPMVYILIVFRILGYPEDHPARRRGPQAPEGLLHSRRRRHPHPAVPLAGLGHGHRAARISRERHLARQRRGKARDAVAAVEGVQVRLRLAAQLRRCAGRRMVLRI
jgi:squalene-hopene/tetraprenyl-beta-curcumene cyclase